MTVSIVLNGKDRTFEAGTTITAVVATLDCGTRGVAVAVNHEVVPHSRWADVELVSGDRVEVLKAAQGG